MLHVFNGEDSFHHTLYDASYFQDEFAFGEFFYQVSKQDEKSRNEEEQQCQFKKGGTGILRLYVYPEFIHGIFAHYIGLGKQ